MRGRSKAAWDLLARHSLNATDAVILRSVLNLRQALAEVEDDLLLWVADKRLLRAAEREGVTVFDPEEETIDHLHHLLGAPEKPSGIAGTE
jgi:hypothetical protein